MKKTDECFMLPIFDAEMSVQMFYCRILELKSILDSKIRFIKRTDGIIENERKGIKLIAEFKKGGDLRKNDFLVKCICQVLAYMHQLDKDGDSIPNYIFIGNEERYCVFEASLIEEAFKLNIDWFQFSAASKFFETPPPELKKYLDDNIDGYNIHKISIDQCILLEDLFKNLSLDGLKINVNINNNKRIFEDFMFSNIYIENPKKPYSIHEVIYIFNNIICNDYVLNGNTILIQMGNVYKSVKIIINHLNSFKQNLKTIDSETIKDSIIGNQDTLVERIYKRFHGEYYTPKIWVEEAIKWSSDHFGADFKSQKSVWDCCCGVGNLTLNDSWDKLYCSTLEQSDIYTMFQRLYNTEALKKFQYDMINDDIEIVEGNSILINKLETTAPSLVESFKNNEHVIFFMNPPYDSDGSDYSGSLKSIGKKAEIRVLMSNDKLSTSSIKQKCINFLYKIILIKKKYKCTNISVAFFCRELIFTLPAHKEFRILFQNNFSFKNGFTMPLNEFKGTGGSAKVCFSIWDSSEIPIIKDSFEFTDKVNKNNIISTKGIVTFKNLDNAVSTGMGSRIKTFQPKGNLLKGITPIKLPASTTANPFKIASNMNVRYDYVYFIAGGGSSVWRKYYVTLSCIPIYQSGTKTYASNMFRNGTSYFSARLLPKVTEKNGADEFYYPNINHPEYNQWVNDSIIYALFNNRNHCCSYRELYDSKNQKHRILKNEMFWMSNAEIHQIADSTTTGFLDASRDSIIYNNDRAAFKELQNLVLNDDSRNVLNEARRLVEISFSKRNNFHTLYPQYNLNAWDAGWYQIKKILELYFKDELKEFNELYKTFEVRMREGVYKFGFLK